MRPTHAKTVAQLATCIANGGRILRKIGDRSERCSLTYAVECLESDDCTVVFVGVNAVETAEQMPSNIQNDEIISHTQIACNALTSAIELMPPIGGMNDGLVSQRIITINNLLHIARSAADLAMHQADLRYMTHKDVGTIIHL